MNEFQFTRACIKVFGLIVLILGIVGLLANGTIAAFSHISYSRILDAANAMADSGDSMNAMLEQNFRRSMISHYSRMIGDVIKVVAGILLCTRYTRLARWISRDDPAVA